jgi:hypothetical protein
MSRKGSKAILVAAFALAALAFSPGTGLAAPPSYVVVDDTPAASTFQPGDELSPSGYIAQLYLDDSASMNKSCGSAVAWGAVKLKSATWPIQVTLFTYRLYLDFSWCNYKVTAVRQLWDEPVDTCCNWGWHGNVSKYYTAVGGANLTAYTNGHFASCALGITLCKDRYPWVELRVNGNGKITGYSWGV